jgi:hypothetical protein
MKIDEMLDCLRKLADVIYYECYAVEQELDVNPLEREYNQVKYDLLHKIMRHVYHDDNGDFTSCKNYICKLSGDVYRKKYNMNNKLPLPMHDPNVALEIVKHELWERFAFYVPTNGGSKFLRNMSFDELEALVDKIKLERDKKRLLEL